nr:RNA-binding protein [uncultured Draconibacterium sp.]
MNIYVSNLSYNTTSESLKELFAGSGEVTSANVITDKITGDSRGFGFVEMPDNAEGQKAIDNLNETDFEGKTINVNIARPRTDRNSGGQNNRGGGGFNRRGY